MRLKKRPFQMSKPLAKKLTSEQKLERYLDSRNLDRLEEDRQVLDMDGWGRDDTDLVDGERLKRSDRRWTAKPAYTDKTRRAKGVSGITPVPEHDAHPNDRVVYQVHFEDPNCECTLCHV